MVFYTVSTYLGFVFFSYLLQTYFDRMNGRLYYFVLLNKDAERTITFTFILQY